MGFIFLRTALNDVIISGSIIAIIISEQIAANICVVLILDVSVNSRTKYVRPYAMLWPSTSSDAIMESSARIGIRRFIALVPLGSAPMYMTMINSALANAPCESSGHT